MIHFSLGMNKQTGKTGKKGKDRFVHMTSYNGNLAKYQNVIIFTNQARELLANGSSTVVKYWPCNLKVKGSSPAIVVRIGRDIGRMREEGFIML